jgi:type VI secretion system protein ImpL
MFTNAFKLIFANSSLGNFGIATLLSLLAWFVLPHISISGHKPFDTASVRVFIVALIYIFTMLKVAIAFIIQHKGDSLEQLKKINAKCKLVLFSAYRLSKEKAINGYEYAGSIVKKDPIPRIFKRLPIYIIMGTEASGKKTLIENSGHRILPASYYGKRAVSLVEQHPEFGWYFTDQAIYIVAGKQFKDNIKSFYKLLKCLNKRKSSKPIDGVLISFTLSELILTKHDLRRHVMQDFSDQIKMMHRALKATIPVYALFTKMDLIRGFSEFFSHLSKEELMQLWGLTFPLDISKQSEKIQSYYDTGFDQLINRLSTQLTQVLDLEKYEEKRALIYNFPQQIALFKEPLINFIKEIFSGMPSKDTLQLRGIYFTSASQNGEPYDFIGHAVGSKFDIKLPKPESILESQESYFIYHLFQRVILKESRYVGYSLRMKRLRKWGYALFCLGIPAFILGTAWAFHKTYENNVMLNENINGQIQLYQAAKQNYQIANSSLSTTLSLINPIYKSENKIGQSSDLAWIFYSNLSLSVHAKEAVNRLLTSIYLPRVAINLENVLQQTDLDTNTLYATLKGYLVFSSQADTSPDSIIAPMEIKWEKSYASQPIEMDQLKYYLKRSSGLYITELGVDNALVNKIRLELQQVVPSDRAYALLTVKAMASNLPEIVVSTIAGQSFSSVFDSDNQKDAVSSLYTQAGFVRLFKPNLQNIADQVSKDNHAIGLRSNTDRTESLANIIEDMQKQYNATYQKQWQSVLANVKIKPLHSLEQLSQAYAALSRPSSPFSKLVHIVDDNTRQINMKNITVSEQYSDIHNFASSGITGSELNKVNGLFKSINQLISKMNHSANPQQAALAYMQKFPQAGLSDPLKELAKEANKAPEPIKGWLMQLSQQTWKVIIGTAFESINQKWQAKVAAYYQQHLMAHYPVDLHAGRSLAVDNFAAFFKPNGLVNKFYQQYFASYMVMSKDQALSLKNISGYQLPLNKQVVAFFQDANRIKQDYFTAAGKVQIKFGLTPQNLDNQAIDFNLMIGDQSFSYAHGPQQQTHFQWPFQLNQEDVNLSVRSLSQQAYHVDFDGPWALFKIFSRAHITPIASGYLMEYKLNGLNFSWVCDSDVPVRALTMQDFHGLHFPQNFEVR